MKRLIAVVSLIAATAFAGDTVWYNVDLQLLQWQRPGVVTVNGVDYGPNPSANLVADAGWVSITLDCAWTDTVINWEESPPIRCMTQEELDARAAAEAEAIAEAEALAGPEPEVFVPLLDENGEPVGTARIVVIAGSLAVVASTNTASPQATWAEQKAVLLSQLATVAESKASAAAARLAVRQTVLAGEVPEEDLTAIVDLWPAWAAGTAYTVDEIVRHEGTLYKVIQAHTSQADWTPDVVPALFTAITPPGFIAEWVQPYGGSGTYESGSIVTHNGLTWSNNVPPPTLNVWEPGVYGWTQL